MFRVKFTRHTLAVGTLACALLASGCAQRMTNQPKYKPYAASSFFADGQSARPLMPDTVSRDDPQTDEQLDTGMVGGQPVDTFPLSITKDVLLRGRQRFDIFCSECHGRTGSGDGMIVQRGFKRPPSFHTDRLRAAPVGHFFDVITNGFGAMASYAADISVQDRWAIISYIRALQLSQHAAPEDAPPDQRKPFEEGVIL
jgi:mono/diheme cytochrome c family protein